MMDGVNGGQGKTKRNLVPLFIRNDRREKMIYTDVVQIFSGAFEAVETAIVRRYN